MQPDHIFPRVCVSFLAALCLLEEGTLSSVYIYVDIFYSSVFYTAGVYNNSLIEGSHSFFFKFSAKLDNYTLTVSFIISF